MIALAAPYKLTPRAPRGGAFSPVNGRWYRGGCWMPRTGGGGFGLDWDVTRDDVIVTVTNPVTGGSRTFRVETLESGELAGRRVASILSGENPHDRFAWTGFAWADEYGLSAWHRFKADKRVTGPNGYVALLTESARFAMTGVSYTVCR